MRKSNIRLRVGFTFREEGFTLIELMITMVITVLVIAAASNVFTGLIRQFKQQSRIAETNIEGIVGLEVMRQDLSHMGYGLPWGTSGTAYHAGEEASGVGAYATANTNSKFCNDAAVSPPRPVVARENTGMNGSDHIAIKGMNLIKNSASEKWTRWTVDESGDNILTDWTPGESEDLDTTDMVAVVREGATQAGTKQLISYNVPFSTIKAFGGTPPSRGESHVIYGIDPFNARMSFNRADYFITPSFGAVAVPRRCAPNTGVLVKAPICQLNSYYNFSNETTASVIDCAATPILDCVADMQVIFGFDMDDNGTIGTYSSADGTSFTSTEAGSAQSVLLLAADIRDFLREVRVYILAHEGMMDRNYRYPLPTINVGNPIAAGRVFDLTTIHPTDYRNYRWKVYTIILKPQNLGG